MATALDVTPRSAVVELRPCWLARLLGARTVRVALVRMPGDRDAWYTGATHERLNRAIGRDGRILDALDFRTVAALPVATARTS